jgi:hypothetical protein
MLSFRVKEGGVVSPTLAWGISIACVVVYVLSLMRGTVTIRQRWLSENGFTEGITARGHVRGPSPDFRGHLREVSRNDERAFGLLRRSGQCMIFAFVVLFATQVFPDSRVNSLGRAVFVVLEILALVLNLGSTGRVNSLLRRELDEANE